ncbi:hypothetical protein ACLOJK_008403 [Asimina triloba]
MRILHLSTAREKPSRVRVKTRERCATSALFSVPATAAMYGAAPSPPDSDRTAFRQAEKKYKLYKSAAAPNSRRRKPQQQQPQPDDVDLSDVYDFKSVLETFEREHKTPAGIFPLPSDFHRPVFCLQDRPGSTRFSTALNRSPPCLSFALSGVCFCDLSRSFCSFFRLHGQKCGNERFELRPLQHGEFAILGNPFLPCGDRLCLFLGF